MMEIDWRGIEDKWKNRWFNEGVFEADPQPGKPKIFITFPFPYVNGSLHVGHGFSATRLDVYARFKRMQGYNVLFPFAWHWTGEPILGAAERIRKGDEKLIRTLKAIDGIPDEEIRNFANPVYMATYYMRENKKIAMSMGFSVDWRREFHTTSHHPAFSKFVTWQFNRLRKLGYIVKGTHPVVWCPNCQSPTGDHDRLEGEGVSPELYVLVKFRCEDKYLLAATFRPETIFGATNVWINPRASYVEAVIDGERWIVSEQAAFKLKEQLRNVEIVNTKVGRELLGLSCEVPLVNREVVVLPASFVDPESGTGVVFSVPSHAPYDWLALRDLMRRPETLKEYGLNPKVLENIKPISIIMVEGFGEHPAIEAVEKMGVENQLDPKADEATKLIYKKEYHLGTMKDNCLRYSKLKVLEAKAKIAEDLKKLGLADQMYDLPERVVCRCGTRCIVKILVDQWFLKYSDPAWKEKTRKLITKLNIYPDVARNYFFEVVDWLRDWACARRTGLGTPLPWDPSWIVETLSDSTVYMAFYIIAKYINQGLIKAENLTEEFFDYVFLGEGNPKLASSTSGLELDLIEKIRREFLYWYPVDLRGSGKDLVPNHLTFFLFHHTALFPEDLWPRGVTVNGIVMVEGEKMSKSKGNFVTLRDAIARYGADAVRCTLMMAAEGMDDPDWRFEACRDMKDKLNQVFKLIVDIVSMEESSSMSLLDEWLLSRLHRRVKAVTDALESLKNRTALNIALFEVWNDLRWYLRRTQKPCKKVLMKVAKTWVKLLAPFAPFMCEELWSMLGGEDFVSKSQWPSYNEEEIDYKAEASELVVMKVMEDLREILKVSKITPSTAHIYVASKWKWNVYLKALEAPSPKEALRSVMEYSKMLKVRDLKISQRIALEASSIGGDEKEVIIRAGTLDEYEILRSAMEFLEREFKFKIRVWREEEDGVYDPKGRRFNAIPYKPAIYLE
ncbi:MAG: leucine--tRNA ligase [Candidatus Nezhaarchaeota archaeon]|nr:leucine--tRNA ligase [Candidatus Nezhaarchaeota archaeon]MCX8142312.1 leucine--tRNA ligase [Candidatus Nezhaarchaeota archaeon]MDW8050715.1 leucine--tRNA ligase [Nitrososphaerota archaeon]